jgi:anti-anti-sigma factor
MKVKVQTSQNATICRLTGFFDRQAQDALETSLAPLEPGRRVIFEISEVPLVDSAGLAILLRAVRQVRRGGGEAVISCNQPSVRRVLEAVVVPSNASVLSDETAAMSYLLPVRAA